MISRPAIFTFFPYTTLFRSISGDGGFLYNAQELATAVQYGINVIALVFNDNAYGNVARDLDEAWGGSYGARSEEHTSELQSRLHLVCRLLLEKKKNRQIRQA